jgi:protein TonB
VLRERIGLLGISIAVHAGVAAILATLAVVHLGVEFNDEPIELVVIEVADVEPEPEPPEPEVEPDPEIPIEPRPREVPRPVAVARVEKPKPFQPEVITSGEREAPDAEAVPAPTAPMLSMSSTVGGGADVDYISTSAPGGPVVPGAGPGTGAPGEVANQAAADVAVAADWQVTSLPQPLNDRSFEPRYPPLARREGREATVLLALDVGADGRVIGVEVLRGPSGHGFRKSAVEYARKLRFKPARARDAEVAARIEWTVYFNARN